MAQGRPHWASQGEGLFSSLRFFSAVLRTIDNRKTFSLSVVFSFCPSSVEKSTKKDDRQSQGALRGNRPSSCDSARPRSRPAGRCTTMPPSGPAGRRGPPHPPVRNHGSHGSHGGHGGHGSHGCPQRPLGVRRNRGGHDRAPAPQTRGRGVRPLGRRAKRMLLQLLRSVH